MIFVSLFSLVVLSMLAFALLPDRLCNRYRRQTIGLMLWQTRLALLSIVGILVTSLFQPLPLNFVFVSLGQHQLGLYLDALSLTLLTLVSFMAAIIGQFSLRYLDGEATQGRFMKWLSFSAATVLLFVASNHLILFMAAWIASSLGLHQLLTHYADRPQAILAARKKFLVSRLGDLFLIAAFSLIYFTFGSWNYGDLFSLWAVDTGHQGLLNLICFLLVAGAMTKSAQFPLHSWLPETMETPTPVSAFMHAGIINAGGFLILRLSPLLVKSPLALNTLACVGGFTALFAALVMLTQTSIKKRLTYSTVSQMGFMMLQCGLGAFSAATVHIVAHSLYKAYAFLSSGSVLQQVQQARYQRTRSPQAMSLLHVAALLMVSFSVCSAAAWIWQVPVLSKPGGVILLLILSLGCVSLALQSYENSSARSLPFSTLASFGIGLLYFGVYRGFDAFLGPVFGHPALSSPLEISLGIGIGLGFLSVFLIEKQLRAGASAPWSERLYILIRNEFYADIYLKRICRWNFVPVTRHPSDC